MSHAAQLHNKLTFMSGLNSREDLSTIPRERLNLSSRVKCLEFLASETIRNDIRVLVDNGEFSRNCHSSILSITSNHDNSNSCSFALSDGLLDFGADGVLDAHDAEEGAAGFVVVVLFEVAQFLGDVLRVQVLQVSSVVDDCSGEAAETSARHLLHGGEELFLLLAVEGANYSVFGLVSAAFLDHALWRTLEQDLVSGVSVEVKALNDS